MKKYSVFSVEKPFKFLGSPQTTKWLRNTDPVFIFRSEWNKSETLKGEVEGQDAEVEGQKAEVEEVQQ